MSAACLLLLSSCAASQQPAHPPPSASPRGQGYGSLLDLKALRPREELPVEVREMLSARMARHGEQMTDLLLCVVMLDYELVGYYANKLGSEPKLGRPAPGEDGTLNAMLPPAFFVHQDELATSARSLAQAATERDDQQLVRSFAAVTRSCVGCHAAYRTADFGAFDHDEPSEEGPCEPGGPCAYEGHDGDSSSLHAPARL